jgi:hypothetical protein
VLQERQMTNRDPFNNRSLDTRWGPGSIIATVVAVMVVIAVIAYGMNHSSTGTGSNSAASTSESATTGQGGPSQR